MWPIPNGRGGAVLEVIGSAARHGPAGTAENRTIHRSELAVVWLLAITEGSAQLRGGGVINLGIDFVKIVNRGQVQVDVVDDTWKVGRRNQRDDLRDNRVDPVLWNEVSGERRLSCPIGVAGSGIVDGIGRAR